MFRLSAKLALLFAASTVCRAQLAITEVHSSEGTTGAPEIHADWFELTNFGTQPVDLTGWILNDTTGGVTTGAVTLGALSIAAGESIVFVEGLEAQVFRNWWGSSVGEAVQIVTYSATGIGLSSSGDGIRLWAAGATADTAPALSVDFGPAGASTATFTYDQTTGDLTARSVAGVRGAFAALDNGDAGSPGVSQGTVALSILSPPVDLTVNPGDAATFVVAAAGMPRPRYQWWRGDEALAGQTASSLTISNVQAALTGSYSVVLDNGLGSVTSAPVQLRLAEAPAAPSFTQELTNVTVFAGGAVEFTVVATGVPQPSLAWYFGTQPITGETGAVLRLSNLTTNQTGTYTVVASNASGSVTNSAMLTVLGRPDIRFTEVSSARTVLDPGFIDRNGFGPEDWWELTSFSTVPVSLTGWRIDDNSASLGAAITITNENLVINPGESIVFVERLTPEQFRVWWGTNELPAGIKIITYTGSGIGLGSGGDALRLWNATATDNADTIAAVDFGAGEPGVSFNYDPDTGVFGGLSVLGVNGVYQAPGTLEGVNELGSPGRIREGVIVTPPQPPVAVVSRDGDALKIGFTAEAGRTYRLQRRGGLSGDWANEGAPVTPASAGAAEFSTTIPAGVGAGFFRITAE
jgi:hypothetical protein